MNLFMMYMVGSSISIFPIMMVGMMFVKPVRALLSTNSGEWAIVAIVCFHYLTPTYRFSIQNAKLGGIPSHRSEVGLHPGTTDCSRLGVVQVPVDGSAADTFIGLAGFHWTAKEDGILWWWYQYALKYTIACILLAFFLLVQCLIQ